MIKEFIWSSLNYYIQSKERTSGQDFFEGSFFYVEHTFEKDMLFK
jgi:hypothetical protein